jgi:ankyrin repeat protein
MQILRILCAEADMVKLLLTSKADVNAKDNSGWTALRVASAKGHKDVAKLLGEYGGQN